MSQSDYNSASDAQTAAQLDADVSMEHVAAVYATALMGAARDAGQTQQVLEEFASLVHDVLDAYPKFTAVLASGLIAADDKEGIVDRVLRGRGSALLVNFLKVVARHGRMDLLRAIYLEAAKQYDAERGLVRVRLSTAAPVDPKLADRLSNKLRSLVGGEPLVELTTDPQLIGGAVLRVGDTIYDGSIANQLKKIREQMIDRSAHEIQSRRDRFRHPAGN